VKKHPGYAWETWFRDDRFTLVRGLDYSCSQSVMAQQVRDYASQNGYRVSIADQNTQLVITVRRRPAEATSAPA
jgi:hypothetical protein